MLKHLQRPRVTPPKSPAGTVQRSTARGLGVQAWLQRSHERQALSTLLAPRPLQSQAKLAIGAVDDPLEQEADRIAVRVLRMPEGGASGAPLQISRICDRCASADHLQRSAAGDGSSESGVPASVQAVLSSAGRPLDADTRAYFEPRFGHDFSNVRIHAGVAAQESARDVHARAYTVGQDIVLGAGAPALGSEAGRSLMAHELTHVVQQGAGAPLLQRQPDSVSTWAGTFTAKKYFAGSVSEGAGFGAVMDLYFKANDKVDATGIAFVQIATSVKDGQPFDRFAKPVVPVTDPNDPRLQDPDFIMDPEAASASTTSKRWVRDPKLGVGAHIDTAEESRSPLFGMRSEVKGNELTDSKPNDTLTEVGWHYAEQGEILDREARLRDPPVLTTGDKYTKAQVKGEWSQRLETAALAIAGTQRGTFYGSVEWGWSKLPGKTPVQQLPFKLKSAAAPSATLLEAARLWNISKTSKGEETIDVPLGVHREATKAVTLWDSPGGSGKILAQLPAGTPLSKTTAADPKSRAGWIHVVVTGTGKFAGKNGWIKE